MKKIPVKKKFNIPKNCQAAFPSIPKLTKALDDIFSIFIRLRDSDENGIGRCITCGAHQEWKYLQCGHFQSRRHLAVRWDEQNTAAQCVHCNMGNQGRQFEFGLAIDKKYGPGTAEKLMRKKNNTFDKSRFIFDSLINEYTEKVKKLKQEKGIL